MVARLVRKISHHFLQNCIFCTRNIDTFTHADLATYFLAYPRTICIIQTHYAACWHSISISVYRKTYLALLFILFLNVCTYLWQVNINIYNIHLVIINHSLHQYITFLLVDLQTNMALVLKILKIHAHFHSIKANTALINAGLHYSRPQFPSQNYQFYGLGRVLILF